MLAMTDDTVKHYGGLYGLDGSPMDFRTPRVWVALQARSMKEQDAADWLKNSRIFAYWPCYLKTVNAGRGMINGRARPRARYSALIPGYLFVAAREGSSLDLRIIVEQTPGVLGYMRDGSGYPLTIGEADIETIRRIESGENLPPSPKTAHKFKTGDKVRFADDLLGRWPPGKVQRLADDGRISVEVPMLGRVVAILAYPHQIETI